ncbi:MAG: WD domain, G-beta repeat [Syntrophorhabdus sp. PtaU1.Bin050]|nr:MAG: WD domain, G-beta repeat [Syntrophorhabdus sp. PtaU1.Bin050]
MTVDRTIHRRQTPARSASALPRHIIRDILADFSHGTRITHHIGTHLHQYCGVAITADGLRMVTTNRDRTACLWDIASGQCLMVFRGHTGEVCPSTAFTNDEKHIITAADDGTLRMWDCATGGCILILNGHKGDVSNFVISPDNRRIVSSSYYDRTVRVWSLPGGACERVVTPPAIPLGKMFVTKDGKTLVGVANDPDHESIVCRWSLPDLDHPFRFVRASYHNPLWDIALTGDEKLVIALGSALHLFDIHTGEVERVIPLNPYAPHRLAATADNRRLVAYCYPRTIRVVDRETGTIERSFYARAEDYDVSSIAITSDGKTLCATMFPNRTCMVWDVGREKCIQIIKNPASDVVRLVVSRDGKYLAAVDEGGAAKIWNLIDGSHRTLSHDAREIAFLALPDLIATGHEDGKMCLWDYRSGKAEPIGVLKAHRGKISCLLPFRGGTCLATSSFDEVRLWDIESGDCIMTYSVPILVAALAIDEDAQRMAVGCTGSTHISVYDLQSGDKIAVLEDYNECTGITPVIRDLYYLPGGQGLISCAGDGRVILWNPDTSEAMRAVEEPDSAMIVQNFPGNSITSSIQKFFNSAICSMVVQNDGRHIVTGSGAGGVKRWDLKSGECERCHEDEGFAVKSVALSPDERTLFAAFSDGTVRIIDMGSATVLCAFWNVEEGFFWFTPPDEHAPEGWVWTDREDLLHVVEQDNEGKVLGAIPFSDERRKAYIYTRNNAKMVLARLKGLDEYTRAVKPYILALTKKQQEVIARPFPMLPKGNGYPSFAPETSGKKGEGNA